MSTTQQKNIDVCLRWIIRRDIPEVLNIENESFEFPWLEEDFIRCLGRQRNCIGMSAEHEDRIAGFMIYELHKSRIHVLDFAVAPEYRRQSVGTQMATKLISKLAHQRRSHITLELRKAHEPNTSAQPFFERMGFHIPPPPIPMQYLLPPQTEPTP